MSSSKTKIEQGTVTEGAIGVQINNYYTTPQPAGGVGPTGPTGSDHTHRLSPQIRDALYEAIVNQLGDYHSRRPLYFGAYPALLNELASDPRPGEQYEKDLQALLAPGREAALEAFLTNAQRKAHRSMLSTAEHAITAALEALRTPTEPQRPTEPKRPAEPKRLTAEEVQQVLNAAIKSGLYNKRSTLLTALPNDVAGALDSTGAPIEQLTKDVRTLNGIGAEMMAKWLDTAAFLTPHPALRALFERLAAALRA